jgi:acetaldehyde dehydrogenase/alcohol dehydrogenase
LYDLGFAHKVTKVLDRVNIQHDIFYQVTPDPTIQCIRRGLKELEEFKPDVILALGGGSPMDAAKVMWLLYEQPELKFEGLAMRFMDIRKRVYAIPELGAKAILVAVPTTSGTGSEVTPFSVVTDEATGSKYPLADYALTPHMAIVDPQLVMEIPKSLTAYGGIDALVHALESYVSILATDYTKGLSKEAIVLLFQYLPRAYHDGKKDSEAREKVHYAATIAGMAFANAFLGVCHSMAHKLGAKFDVAHGLANAALISHVIRYNATEKPLKQPAFPLYQYPQAIERYAEIADALNLGGPGMSNEDKVVKLIGALEDLKAELGIPDTVKEILGQDREEEYIKSLDLLAVDAFDDQCTGANPRYPLVEDLKKMYTMAWEAPVPRTLPFD